MRYLNWTENEGCEKLDFVDRILINFMPVERKDAVELKLEGISGFFKKVLIKSLHVWKTNGHSFITGIQSIKNIRNVINRRAHVCRSV
jgi:hypothetical protein